MALEIGDVEKRLKSLIEVNLAQHLPGVNYQDRIAQRLSEGLRAHLSLGGKLPKDFALAVHPSSLRLWHQNDFLLEELTRIFQQVVGEIEPGRAAAPSLTLIVDPLVETEDLQLRVLKETNVAETQDAATPAVENRESPPTRPAFLIVGGTKVFPIKAAVTNIGRRADNHLVIDDPRISRYHSQVRFVRGRFIIFDLNSTGGTYVNGQRVNQSVLYPGDVISLAGLPIVFGQDSPRPVTATGDRADTAPLTSPAPNERNTVLLKTIPPELKNDK